MNQLLDKFYRAFLSAETKERGERAILVIAVASFLIHLLLIYLSKMDILFGNSESTLLKNPIAAIYTPFSFILVYEVYLLIYYLPKSITTYINKQYEIITLIIIRRLFKDLSALELTPDWFKNSNDLLFTFDLIASLLLFFLLYLFFRQSKKSNPGSKAESELPEKIRRFINFKKVLATLLVPILFILASYTLSNWVYGTFNAPNQITYSFKNINSVFFDEFFTVLIIVDVILLLFSFFHTDQFYKVIRNSGFIISTILIRLSFSVEGITNTVLIVSAVIFGLLILTIHNQYDKQGASDTL